MGEGELKATRVQGKFRGVERSPKQRTWRAVVIIGTCSGKRKKMSVSTAYRTAEAAAVGHDRAAIAVFGRDIAVLNNSLADYPPEVRHNHTLCECASNKCAAVQSARARGVSVFPASPLAYSCCLAISCRFSNWLHAWEVAALLSCVTPAIGCMLVELVACLLSWLHAC